MFYASLALVFKIVTPLLRQAGVIFVSEEEGIPSNIITCLLFCRVVFLLFNIELSYLCFAVVRGVSIFWSPAPNPKALPNRPRFVGESSFFAISYRSLPPASTIPACNTMYTRRFKKTFVERRSWLVPIFHFWRVSQIMTSQALGVTTLSSPPIKRERHENYGLSCVVHST